MVKIRQHFSKMRTICLPTICVSVANTRCQYQRGGGGMGPQVNKFEQVSSDDHLMSVAGRGVGAQVWCPVESLGVQVRYPGGRGALPYDLSHETYDVPTRSASPRPPNGQNDWQTDTCKNITFPQLRLSSQINNWYDWNITTISTYPITAPWS